MKKIVYFPVWQLMLAAYIPVNLYAYNLQIFNFSDTVRSITVFIIFPAFATFVLHKIFRNIHKAALLVALFVVGVWIHQFGNLVRVPYLVYACIMVALIIRHDITQKVSGLLNIFSFALLMVPVVQIFMANKEVQAAKLMVRSPFNNIQIEQNNTHKPYPSIVHIVLDGYASTPVLSEIMDFDNSSFISRLRQLGFVVNENVKAPYNQTLISLSSIFSGEYHNPAQSPFNISSPAHLRMHLGNAIANGPIQNFLKQFGYQSAILESGYKFLNFSSPETLVDSLVETTEKRGIIAPPNRFEQFLYENTALRLISYLIEINFNKAGNKNTYVENHLKKLHHALHSSYFQQLSAPFFHFQHVIAPHPPFVIDRYGVFSDRWFENFSWIADGDYATRGERDLQLQYIQGYLEKLRYTNQMIVPRLEQLIDEIPTPKIIILHGDHGSGSLLFQNDASSSCLKERMNTILAIYSDDTRLQNLTEVTAPEYNLVNLYRTVIGKRFGINMGLLENRQYFSPWKYPANMQRLSASTMNNNCSI